MKKFSSNKTIGIDATFFAHSEAKKRKLSYSISIYAAAMFDAFTRLGVENKFSLIVNFNHVDFFKERFPRFKLCVIKWWPVTLLYRLTRGKRNAIRLIKRLGIYRRIVEREHFSALWFIYGMNETFIKTRYKTFATVHDLYRLHNGTERERGAFRSFLFDSGVTLIAASNYTKGDIERELLSFGQEESRNIEVIHSANNFEIDDVKEIESVKHFIETGGKFILDINAYTEKKNTLTLLRAFNLVKDRIPHSLFFCGAYKDESYFSTLERYVEENNLESRVVFFFNIEKGERNYLLHTANLFVTPSLYEGFGLTPIEAALSLVPVVSSTETSLKEVTLGLCNYVIDARNKNEYASLILKVLDNYPTKESLVSIREKLKSEYNTLNYAKKYLSIFKTELERNEIKSGE